MTTWLPSSAPVPEGEIIIERGSTAKDVGPKLNRSAADIMRFLFLQGEIVTAVQGLTDDMIEKMSAGAESGVLVAVSAGAFLLNEDMTPWSGVKPKAGDRVYIEKYAGKQVKGRDGATYRIMDYGSIGATYESDVEEKTGDK